MTTTNNIPTTRNEAFMWSNRGDFGIQGMEGFVKLTCGKSKGRAVHGLQPSLFQLTHGACDCVVSLGVKRVSRAQPIPFFAVLA